MPASIVLARRSHRDRALLGRQRRATSRSARSSTPCAKVPPTARWRSPACWSSPPRRRRRSTTPSWRARRARRWEEGAGHPGRSTPTPVDRSASGEAIGRFFASHHLGHPLLPRLPLGDLGPRRSRPGTTRWSTTSSSRTDREVAELTTVADDEAVIHDGAEARTYRDLDPDTEHELEGFEFRTLPRPASGSPPSPRSTTCTSARRSAGSWTASPTGRSSAWRRARSPTRS